MEYSKYEIEKLANIGLNSLEISIFLALSRSEKASISTLSKVLNLRKFEVYKSLIKLYDFGMVEEVPGDSVLLRVVSTQQLLDILSEKMINDSARLKVDIQSLMASIKIAEEYRVTDSKFVVIPQKDKLLKKVMKTAGKCQKNADFIVTWGRFESARMNFPENFQMTAKCRCILEQPLRSHDFDVIRKVKRAGCEIRFIPNHQDVALGIFDGKEMVIVENSDYRKINSTSLWTDNKSILTIAKIYFENLWLLATEKPLITN